MFTIRVNMQPNFPVLIVMLIINRSRHATEITMHARWIQNKQVFLQC